MVENFERELDDLRKFKQKEICDDLKECFSRTGEHLDRDLLKIKELLDLQEKRISYFQSLFD